MAYVKPPSGKAKIDLTSLGPKQVMALNAALSRKYAVVLVKGGIQSGKSYVGARFAAIRTVQNNSTKPFWIASPTLKMARAPELSFMSTGIEGLLIAKNMEEREYT